MSVKYIEVEEALIKDAIQAIVTKPEFLDRTRVFNLVKALNARLEGAAPKPEDKETKDGDQ